MNITITPNTTPIGGDVLNPVPKSFASGGGSGGGGGPVNFLVGGGGADGINSGGAANVGPGASQVISSDTMDFIGGRLLFGQAFLIFFPGASPYGGFNHSLQGSVSVTITWQTGKTSTQLLTPANNGVYVPIQKLVGSDAEVNAIVKVEVTNNLYWRKDDAPIETTPTSAQISSTLIVMEL